MSEARKSTLTADDPRYSRMFDAAKEAEETSGGVFGDLTPAMSALREQAPAMKGSLRELLKLPETHHNFDRPRPHYTIFTFKSCDRAFRENLVFSSEVYRESPGVQMLGHTILEMVGDEHRRHRAVVQPMFVRPRAMTWWKKNWIDEAVDVLLERFDGKDGADLNLELCARLPVYIVTRGIGMSGADALNFREHLLRSTFESRRNPEEAKKAAGEVARMLKELIVARRATPGDDVVTGLVVNDFETTDGGKRKLTDEEIFGYCRLIMLAGGGTTWRQLGITLNALLTNYHFWEACRDRPQVARTRDRRRRALVSDGSDVPASRATRRGRRRRLDCGGLACRSLSGCCEPRPRALAESGYVRHLSTQAISPRFRSRPASVPRHERREAGDDHGDQRIDGPFPEHALRSCRAQAATRRWARAARYVCGASALPMSARMKQVVLRAHPQGAPREEDFGIETVNVPTAGPDQVLVRTLWLALDPLIRFTIDAVRLTGPTQVKIGEPMYGGTVSQVASSNHPNYVVGDFVEGRTGWREYAAVDPNTTPLRKLDPNVAPLSTALGAVGMPGQTAYACMINIGRVAAGETVVISAAGGAVGSTAGQIGKILGARVIGIAGGATKCRAVEALGFDACVDYKAPDFATRLAAACSGGVDVYVENVGGAVTDAVLPHLKYRARMPVCGFIAYYGIGKEGPGPDRLPGFMRTIMSKGLEVRGFGGAMTGGSEALKQLAAWVQEGRLRHPETIVDGIESAPQSLRERFPLE